MMDANKKCRKAVAQMTRREFLAAVAGFSATGLMGSFAEDPSNRSAPLSGRLDPYAIGVISDIHTGLPWSKQKYRTGREYPWQPQASQKLVAEILAMPNPPANVIGLGDISLAFGETEDYEIAADVLKPLSDAGIKVTLAMGNHDIRAEFSKFFPGYDKTTKVPGRFVSVVETPCVDFILLDSLKEPVKRGDYAACTGFELGEAQKAWLGETLESLEKPTFVCAHHTAWDLKIDKICCKAPKVVGYLHGHHHRWMANYLHNGYSDKARVVRMVGLPSFGLDFDVGWGLIRTSPGEAVLECKARDFYFPKKLAETERPSQWDMYMQDWIGHKFSFSLMV